MVTIAKAGALRTVVATEIAVFFVEYLISGLWSSLVMIVVRSIVAAGCGRIYCGWGVIIASGLAWPCLNNALTGQTAEWSCPAIVGRITRAEISAKTRAKPVTQSRS